MCIVAGAHRGQKKMLDLMDLELEAAVCHLMYMLENSVPIQKK